MLELLNALYIVVGAVLSLQLYPAADAKLTETLGEVTQIEFHTWANPLIPLRPRFASEKCRYTGVAAPYDRTWEERVSNAFTDTTLPPEPGKIVGYVAFINKKQCEGQEPEYMLRADTVSSWAKSHEIYHASPSPIYATLVSKMDGDIREKAVKQALEYVTKAAETDVIANTFLVDVQKALEKKEKTEQGSH